MDMATSKQIDANLSAVRDLIATLENEARDLSLPAISGDQNAVTSLASLRAKIQQASADLDVLQDAKASALGQEAEAADVDAKNYRARHMAIAQDRSAAIVKLAGRAEELVAEFKDVLTNISTTERQIWNALREASAPPDSGIVGRKNLVALAIDRMTTRVNGKDIFLSDQRALADVARTAWRNLLVTEGDDV